MRHNELERAKADAPGGARSPAAARSAAVLAVALYSFSGFVPKGGGWVLFPPDARSAEAGAKREGGGDRRERKADRSKAGAEAPRGRHGSRLHFRGITEGRGPRLIQLGQRQRTWTLRTVAGEKGPRALGGALGAKRRRATTTNAPEHRV